MTPIIILAAGASTRLGSPKQLVRLDDETLLDRAVRTAREAGCHPIHVVLGANAPLIQQTCHLNGIHLHINSHWQEGMASSIRYGIQSIAPAEGALLMTCDMPAVTPAHLRALAVTGHLTASHYAGHNGIPAYFPAATFAVLRSLSGDTGARDVLRIAPAIPLEGGDLDIDTPEDVSRLSNEQSLAQSGGTHA